MRISIRSTDVLSLLGVLAIGLMVWVELSKKEVKEPYFDEKMEAAMRMRASILYLKDKHFKNEISVDNINDPNDTKIIGTQFSPITSGKGSLPSKLSTVNPNVAALVVELFKEAGLKKGDHIAMCATGSFPGLNIAVCTAAEVMGLKTSLIVSVTSSSWGANDPDYTYLDIHSSLTEGGFLQQGIIAASIGGNDDLGKTLSAEGRDLAVAAINRNNIEIISGGSLSESIERRLALFKARESLEPGKIAAFVNIGGGIASLGSARNAVILPSGVIHEIKLRQFPDKQGVMFAMAAGGTKIINFLNVNLLFDRYKLPEDPVPLPQPGTGELFYKLKYNYLYVLGALLTLVSALVAVILFDKKQNAIGKNIIYSNHESVLSDSL